MNKNLNVEEKLRRRVRLTRIICGVLAIAFLIVAIVLFVKAREGADGDIDFFGSFFLILSCIVLCFGCFSGRVHVIEAGGSKIVFCQELWFTTFCIDGVYIYIFGFKAEGNLRDGSTVTLQYPLMRKSYATMTFSNGHEPMKLRFY